ELFRYRSQTESRIQFKRCLLLVIGHAIGLTEQYLVALGHQNRACELLVRGHTVEPLFQLWQLLDDGEFGPLQKRVGIRRNVRRLWGLVGVQPGESDTPA